MQACIQMSTPFWNVQGELYTWDGFEKPFSELPDDYDDKIIWWFFNAY